MEVSKIQYEDGRFVYTLSDGKKYSSSPSIKLEPLVKEIAAQPLGDFKQNQFLVLWVNKNEGHKGVMILQAGGESVETLERETQFRNLVYYNNLTINQQKDKDFKSYEEYKEETFEVLDENTLVIRPEKKYTNQFLVTSLPIDEYRLANLFLELV